MIAWLRALWARLTGRARRVDTSVYTHVYTGPATHGGLPHGARLRIAGKGHRDKRTGQLGRGSSGGRLCETPDGRQWLLAREHLSHRP